MRCCAPLVEQHPLGDGRLAGVDVGNDADVADLFEVRAMDRRSQTPRLR